MTDKTDSRIIRTKQMLRRAMLELMEEKGFDAINIRDLTERAGLNRGTFYLHYKDKYDLLEQSTEELIGGIVAIMKTVNPLEFGAHRNLDEPHPLVMRLFEYLYEHASFFKVIFGPGGDPNQIVKLRSTIAGHIRNRLAEIGADIPTDPLELEFFIAYVASANVGIIRHWFESGMVYSPRHVAVLYTRVSVLGPMKAIGGVKQI